MVTAVGSLEKERAAFEVLTKLIEMSAESNWRKCIVGGVCVRRLVRWSNETSDVQKLRSRMVQQMIAILSCRSFRIDVPCAGRSALVILGGQRSFAQQSGNMILWSDAKEANKLSTAFQLQTELSKARGEAEKWYPLFSILVGEISAHQATYAKRTNALDRLSGSHIRADMVLNLGLGTIFDVDRKADITKFSPDADEME